MRNNQERLVYLCIAMDKQKQLTKVKIDLKRNLSPSYNKLWTFPTSTLAGSVSSPILIYLVIIAYRRDYTRTFHSEMQRIKTVGNSCEVSNDP